MGMKSLKISAKKAKEKNQPMPSLGGEDRYPYGTRIDLDKDSLEQLGIKNLPAVGTEMMIECKVTVIAVRESASQENTSRSMELQITAMDIEADEDEVGEGELTRGQSKAIGAVAKKMQDM